MRFLKDIGRLSDHHADKPLHKHWQIVLAVAMIVGAFAGFVWIAYKIPMQ